MKDLKNGYPPMPEAVREMIYEEVSRHTENEKEEAMRSSQIIYMDHDDDMMRASKLSHALPHGRATRLKRTWVIGLAASLAVGITAFAGMTLRRILSEKQGNYGLNTSIRILDTEKDGTDTEDRIFEVSITWNNLPEGMVVPEDDPWKAFSTDHPYEGGVTAAPIIMNSDREISEAVRNTNVLTSEDMTISGHDAVYLELYAGAAAEVKDAISFDKRLYIAYPEYQRVLELFCGEDLSKETFVSIAEAIELRQSAEEIDPEHGSYVFWDDVANPETDTGMAADIRFQADAAQMKNLHNIGDTVSVSMIAHGDGEDFDAADLSVTVTDVQIADDLSLLSSEADIPDHWFAQVGADGALMDESLQYVRYGDGIDTLDEVVKERSDAQKLVYLTVEVENRSETDYRNILYYMPLLYLKEDDGIWSMKDQPAKDDDWDAIIHTGVGGRHEMAYFDVHPNDGTTNGSNYIASLKAGESTALHLAWIVDEEDLPDLYLSFDPSAYTITDEALAIGYVHLL